MSTRLTYTSGELGAETDAEFEDAARGPRAAGGGEPLPALPSPALTSRAARRSSASTRAPTTRSPAARSRRRPRSSRAPSTPRAWPPGRGAATPWAERCALLRAVADGIGERHLELAAVVSLETGKSRTESILEVQEAIDLITTYADHMEGNDGYVVPLASFVADERNTDVLRPYGIFAVIAPFNFPAALSVGMAASALIAGNTVVFKPSEETPWTGAILGEIARAAELPPGVFNLVHGGETTGRALVDARVDGVAFTGSAAVGREIARKMQEGPYARPALTEMGGKNPAIVTANADLDRAAEGVARAAFGLAGQKCSACSRAIVVRRRPRRLRRAPRRVDRAPAARRSRRSRELRGAGRQRGGVARFEDAVAARAATGWWPPAEATRSARHFVEPTVVCDLPLGHPLERDELFLPFVTVTRVGSLDEALAEANAPAYGLTGGHLQRGPVRARSLPRRDPGRRGLRQPAGGRHHRRLAGNADVLRLEVERLDGQGRPRSVLPRAVHARAEPDRGRIEP